MLDRRLPCAILMLMSVPVANAETYGVADRWALGGDGKWDYPSVDSAAHRLYLSRATHVTVVDTGTGKSVGDITDTPGVHGIAIAHELGHGFISLGKANRVEVFDLKTNQGIATIEVGSKPDSILYDDYSHQVFAFNGHGDNVSVIDAKTSTVIATIALGGNPEAARGDERGMIFVNIENKNELAQIDAGQRKVVARWPLPGCNGPTGLALDVDHHRSFSVCANAKMTILNTGTGKAIATLPIGARADSAVFDAVHQDAFSANGDGTMTVVHESDPEHFAVAQVVKTAVGARNIALDDTTHRLYLPTASFDQPRGEDSEAAMIPDTFGVLVVEPRRKN